MATLDALRQRQTEIRARLEEIEAESGGERLNQDQKTEWENISEELVANEEHVIELEKRAEWLAKIAGKEENREGEPRTMTRHNVSRVPDDPTDLMAYRQTAGNVDQLHEAYQEGALRLIDRMVPAVADADREKTQAHLDKLIRYVDSSDDRMLARRVIATSSTVYNRAFGKYVQGHHRNAEEERALSLTTTAGGFAVPYTLDPTVILTSAGAINPVRSLARIETITGNNWIGVSSAGVSAAYSAEVTETSDNAPTLAQPSLNVEKAQAFIPFSIEIGGDWGSLQSEMGRLFADAKNRLESTKFLTGVGHGSNEPQGLIAVGGATAVVTSATTATFAVADLYNLYQTLNPRFRVNGTFVGNLAAFNKIRQFDTAGGASLWVQLQYSDPATLLGRPAVEWSDYSSAVTTSAATILTYGDFSNFLIVDRVGMDVELIPHLFATANNRPSGQRGLYCYWRNSSIVLTPGLLANSAFVSLKLL